MELAMLDGQGVSTINQTTQALRRLLKLTEPRPSAHSSSTIRIANVTFVLNGPVCPKPSALLSAVGGSRPLSLTSALAHLRLMLLHSCGVMDSMRLFGQRECPKPLQMEI